MAARRREELARREMLHLKAYLLDRVRSAVQTGEYTQAQFAERAGISKGWISAILNDPHINPPGEDVVFRILDAFDLTFSRGLELASSWKAPAPSEVTETANMVSAVENLRRERITISPVVRQTALDDLRAHGDRGVDEWMHTLRVLHRVDESGGLARIRQDRDEAIERTERGSRKRTTSGSVRRSGHK